jgi:hypothetical protein
MDMRTERARARTVAAFLGALVLVGLLSVATVGGMLPGWLAPTFPAGGAPGLASLPAPSGSWTHPKGGSKDAGSRGAAEGLDAARGGPSTPRSGASAPGSTGPAGSSDHGAAALGGAREPAGSSGPNGERGRPGVRSCAAIGPSGASPARHAASRASKRAPAERGRSARGKGQSHRPSWAGEHASGSPNGRAFAAGACDAPAPGSVAQKHTTRTSLGRAARTRPRSRGSRSARPDQRSGLVGSPFVRAGHGTAVGDRRGKRDRRLRGDGGRRPHAVAPAAEAERPTLLARRDQPVAERRRRRR